MTFLDNYPNMKHSHTILIIALSTAMLVTTACGTPSKPPTVIVVPSAATSAHEYTGAGAIPSQRYVVRMSDGERDWEVEFPEVATGYELKIPLKNNPGMVSSDSHKLTTADKALIEHMRRTNPDMEREGVFKDGQNLIVPDENQPAGAANDPTQNNQPGAQANKKDPTEPAPTRPSYMLTIEEVQKLYRSGNYELAMVRIADLERAYPNDIKILSMKGTLWLKLGRPELAREAWEQVLQIDPDNRQVIDALKTMNQ